MNRNPHHRIPSWPPPARRGSCSRAKIVSQKQETSPEPCCAIWDEDFFWSSPPNLRVKLFYASQILFVLLLPRSRYSGATPCCEIDQSCMPITRRQNIYLKTPRISIEKHVKTAFWQLSTHVPIKSRKNTVLIRVKIDTHDLLVFVIFQHSNIAFIFSFSSFSLVQFQISTALYFWSFEWCRRTHFKLRFKLSMKNLQSVNSYFGIPIASKSPLTLRE